jgi:hypothetical protein
MIKIKLEILKLLKDINNIEKNILILLIDEINNEEYIKENKLILLEKTEKLKELEQKEKEFLLRNINNKKDININHCQKENNKDIEENNNKDKEENNNKEESKNQYSILQQMNSNKKKAELEMKEEKRRLKNNKLNINWLNN